MPTDPLDVPPGSLTLEAITDLLDSGGSAPAGVTGDLQFNKGDGTFADADEIASGALASLDDSGNLTFAGTGNITFVAELANLSFEANDQYTAGATTIQLNAGGDTSIIIDSSVNPETITLDSDLNNTLIKLAPSVGQSISIGNATGFKLGFFGITPIVKPTITGAKAGNTAVAGIVAVLVALGLATDGTT